MFLIVHRWRSCNSNSNLLWNKLLKGAAVLHLMELYFYKGYHLFTDKWYNSISLTEYRSNRKKCFTGTFRTDGKRNPRETITKKFNKVKKFSNLLMMFLSWSGKERGTFVLYVMLIYQNWWNPSTVMVNENWGRMLYTFTTNICLLWIKRIKCYLPFCTAQDH